MGAAYFYHLTNSPIAVTLPMLLGKARAAGWRVLVRGTDDAQLDQLDSDLWLKPEDGFLPHGRVGSNYEAEHPILLGRQTDSADFACVMSVGGAEVAAEEVTRLARVCILFDGMDEAAVARARVQWKTLTDAGCAAQYWAQDGTRWEKRAER